MSRKALRRSIIKERDALSAVERSEKSLAIHRHLLALPPFAAAPSALIYVSFRSEVETLPLIRSCLAGGMGISVPRTLVAEGRLLACAIDDPDQDLAPGYCGIYEPLAARPLVVPASLAVVLVPGSVFDRQGGRLGYGGGYYDRFLLNEAPDALRIGLAFSLQLADDLPLLPHDQRLDYLVTEDGALRMERGAG